MAPLSDIRDQISSFLLNTYPFALPLLILCHTDQVLSANRCEQLIAVCPNLLSILTL
jgi:hypothetical protein